MMQSSSSDAFVKEKLSLLVTSTRPINLNKVQEISEGYCGAPKKPNSIFSFLISGTKMGQIKKNKASLLHLLGAD